MVAGGIAAGAPALIFAPAPSAPCSVLSARAAADKFCLTPDAGNSQVSLTWTPSASGINLTIYDGITPGIGKPAKVSTVTDTSALVTGLTNGTRYYFWLVLGKIVVSNTVLATPAAAMPGAPAGLTATAGNAQVTLSWAVPASDGGSPVSGYNVYVAASADFKGAAEVPGVTGTAVVLVGLTNGTTYYFKVFAVNAAGNESPFSTEVSAEPARSASGVTVSLNSPAAPTQLIALLAAVAAMVAAGAFTLIARRRRRFRSRKLARSERSRQQMAVASDVRAVPDTARPDVVSVRDTGREPTHTVRLEPHPGVTTTTIKEGRS